MVALRRASGARIGGKAKGLYACEDCNHCVAQKVESCASCGGDDVLFFGSKAEYRRWHELKLLQRGGAIFNLKRQVSFDLMATGKNNTPQKFAKYIADFTYEEHGENIIEDVKGGAIDPVAALKLKIMAAMGRPVRVIVR